MSRFSRGKLEAGRNELGLCTARYESKRLLLVSFEGLARFSRRVWRRFVRGSREISLVPSLHRASTDALINASSTANRSCPIYAGIGPAGVISRDSILKVLGRRV